MRRTSLLNHSSPKCASVINGTTLRALATFIDPDATNKRSDPTYI